MEDDGDDKDDTKRRTRNLSEKKRRDQFNMLVTELSTLITTNNRKMDKSTVLKSTISFLKNHNEVTVRSRAHDVQEDWKPAFLSNEEFTYLVLEALEGFVMVFSATGRIYYVSESITSLLGHNPTDVVNKSIFDLAFEEDRPNLYNLLQRSAMATEQMSNSSKEKEMIRFEIHLQRGTLDFREDISYDLVQFYGHFQSNPDQADEERDRMAYQQDHDSRMLFICICRLYQPQLIRDVSLVDSSRNEFTSRHSLEWKFLFLDHRAPPIIGYLPFEVLGTSGYDYYHFDDLEKVVTCHEALMQKGELTSCYYRFLTKGQQWIWLQTRFYITYHQWNSKPEFVVCTHRVVSYADVSKTTKEEVEDAEVSEVAVNQNNMKDTPADDQLPSMSPSYMSEDASDPYGNSYQPISQSTFMVSSSIQYRQPLSQAYFTNHTASHAKGARLQVPVSSSTSPNNMAVIETSFPSSHEQTTFLSCKYMAHSSSASVAPSCSDSASAQEQSSVSFSDTAKQSLSQSSIDFLETSQPDSLAEAISHPETLIEAISKSNAAIQAMSQPLSVVEAISQSNVAIQAIAQSNAIINAISHSNGAIRALAQSNAALQAISDSNAVMRKLSQSNEAIHAMSQSDAEVHAITQSKIATQTLSLANAEVQSHSNIEEQNIWLSNTKKSQELSNVEQSQSDAEVQVKWQSCSETQGFPMIPMITITKSPVTTQTVPEIPMPSISPSFTAEIASDDFGNSFQLVSQNRMLMTPSPEPICRSPSFMSDRSDNSFQPISQSSLRTPTSEGRLAVSPYNMSERSESFANDYPPYIRRARDSLSERAFPALSPTCFSDDASETSAHFFSHRSHPASVKSASAGSTVGTINTTATTGASWPRTQARYTAGSETGSLSGDSRSSQRNSERESHKPIETIVAPQHGIGAQYLEPAEYGGGVLPIATLPVLVTSDHAQIQEQLQRKHEELQQMIMRQQEELRQVKEQLLLARLGILQPLINVSNPYSTPEEMQNEQLMTAQLAYTNVAPRAIGYPQHVPLPLPALPSLPSLPQHSPLTQNQSHPQHSAQAAHPQHPPQPPHPHHPSEPHQHMPQ